MVTLANISDKSIHPQEGSKYQKQLSSSFLPVSSQKFGHNSAIVGRTTKWFVPSCSSRDSTSDDIAISY